MLIRKKSKTKWMVFLRKNKDLSNIKLNDKILPWVTKVKHLGSTIKNDVNCDMIQDLLEKRAGYISRNSELNQEFSYAHPSTKIWLNNLYKFLRRTSLEFIRSRFRKTWEKLECIDGNNASATKRDTSILHWTPFKNSSDCEVNQKKIHRILVKN